MFAVAVARRRFARIARRDVAGRSAMRPQIVFLLLTYGALLAWACLIFAPRSRWTRRLVHTAWVPVILSLGFAWALLSAGPWPPGAGFTTLDGVMALSRSPHLALTGWLHAAAFDFFVATWAVRDADRLGIRHGLMVPYLLAAVVVGPIALLYYLVLRRAVARRRGLDEVPARA